MNYKKLKSFRGITMIEMMITVVIIGIVAAMAAPSFERSIQHIKFKSQTKDVISTLRMIRSNAITEKAQYGVNFDFDKKVITAFKDIAHPLDYIYDLGSDSILSEDTLQGDFTYLWSSFSTSSIVFRPNGTASESGDIYLFTESNESYNWSLLNVLASTGRSKIYYIYNY